jgi:hypothetical protein
LGFVHNRKEAKWKSAVHVLHWMKREARQPKLYIYATIIGEVEEGGVGMPIPPKLTNVLDEFVTKCWMSCRK